MGEPELDHIAVLALAAGEEVEPMRAKVGQVAAEPGSFRPNGDAQ